MSECSSNCSSCGLDCPSRKQESLLAPLNAKSKVGKVIAVVSGKGGVGKSLVTGLSAVLSQRNGFRTAILDGDILKAPTKKIPYFNLEVPTELNGVDTGILDPRDTYADRNDWDVKAKDLAGRFIKNFVKYESNEAGKALVAAGPQL